MCACVCLRYNDENKLFGMMLLANDRHVRARRNFLELLIRIHQSSDRPRDGVVDYDAQ